MSARDAEDLRIAVEVVTVPDWTIVPHADGGAAIQATDGTSLGILSGDAVRRGIAKYIEAATPRAVGAVTVGYQAARDAEDAHQEGYNEGFEDGVRFEKERQASQQVGKKPFVPPAAIQVGRVRS